MSGGFNVMTRGKHAERAGEKVLGKLGKLGTCPTYRALKSNLWSSPDYGQNLIYLNSAAVN